MMTDLSNHLSTLAVSDRAHSIIISDADSANIKPGKHTELHAIVYDAKRFILNYKPVIEMASLQLYNSALLFSPAKSIIKDPVLWKGGSNMD